MSVYVNVEQVSAYLSELEQILSDMKAHINVYNATAPSFGESTFRPEIEAQLARVKNDYLQTMEPVFNKMITEMNEVKAAYQKGAEAISNA